MNDSSTDDLQAAGRKRRRRWVITSTAVVAITAIAVGVPLALRDSGSGASTETADDRETPVTTGVEGSVARHDSSSSPRETSRTQPDDDDSSENRGDEQPRRPRTTAGDSQEDDDSDGRTESPVREDPPDVSIPVGRIDEDTPDEVCAAVVERLEQYHSLAEDNSIESVRTLVLTLEEFEHDLFTLTDAELREWGDDVIEELTSVRREWATALAAHEAGEGAESRQRFATAQDHLAAASDIECVTS